MCSLIELTFSRLHWLKSKLHIIIVPWSLRMCISKSTMQLVELSKIKSNELLLMYIFEIVNISIDRNHVTKNCVFSYFNARSSIPLNHASEMGKMSPFFLAFNPNQQIKVQQKFLPKSARTILMLPSSLGLTWACPWSAPPCPIWHLFYHWIESPKKKKKCLVKRPLNFEDIKRMLG